VLDFIIYKQLNWYGHARSMNDGGLPQKNLEWYRPGRKRNGTRHLWIQEVITGMREKGFESM
jgi:hypothetical protein